MSDRRWFSTKLRKVCLVEAKGSIMAMDTICIFRANDFDDAFQRAVKLGRASEEEYRNEEGRLVRWHLKEVVTLDILDLEDLDGVEVYSEIVDLSSEEHVPFHHEFRPQDSKPRQTL